MAADPAVKAPGEVATSPTASQITQLSQALFGAASSAAKQYWEFKAQQQIAKNQPVFMDQYLAQQYGVSTMNTMLMLLGGVAVIALVYMVSKRRSSSRRR